MARNCDWDRTSHAHKVNMGSTAEPIAWVTLTFLLALQALHYAGLCFQD
jgi:hypothetical protein